MQTEGRGGPDHPRSGAADQGKRPQRGEECLKRFQEGSINIIIYICYFTPSGATKKRPHHPRMGTEPALYRGATALPGARRRAWVVLKWVPGGECLFRVPERPLHRLH